MVTQHFSVADLDRFDGREWGKGSERRRFCPHCGDTGRKGKARGSFRYNSDTGKYTCGRCDLRGTLIDYWSSIARCPYCDALSVDIQRAEIWKRWKQAGRKQEDRERVSKEADLVTGLVVDDSGRWDCVCGANGQLKNYAGAAVIRRGDFRQAAEQQQRAQSLAVVSTFVNGVDVSADDSAWREVWADSLSIDWGGGFDYLEGRGLDYDIARAANVRFHEGWGRSDKWAGMPAVLFPMCDRKGNLVAVSGRRADDAEDFRHMTCGQKLEGVFAAVPNVWQAKIVAVCEAPVDALAVVGLFGVPALAVVGKSWPAWLPMALMFKRVLIGSDADDAGDEMADKLAAQCAPYTRRVERLRPDAKDWAEVARRRMLDVTPENWVSPF